MKFSVVVAEAWRSLTASLSTTLAAALTVLIGMFLVGLLIGLGTWARSWSDHAKGKLVIDVFLCTQTTCGQEVATVQTNAIRQLLQNDPRVAPGGIQFVSKEEALQIMKKKEPGLTQNVISNPLPDSFKVKPKRGEDVAAIADSLNPPPAGRGEGRLPARRPRTGSYGSRRSSRCCPGSRS